MSKITSNKIGYSAALLSVVLLGLLSRSGAAFVPSLVKEYAGDALWALAAYLLIRLLFPNLSLRRSAFAAVIVSFGVEFSQLYQAAWLNAVRSTRAGGLLLGHGFLWSDLLCYLIGIGIGVAVDYIGKKIFSRNTKSQ